VLLREAFPRLRRLLLGRPLYLPAALSNAVENLGARGAELARGLADLADDLADGDALLGAGAVLAWRLGEARLRTQALARAGQLPPAVVRRALGLAACPDEAVPRLLAGLAADGWCRPEELLAPSPPSPASAATEWKLAARLGNFGGFDGHFSRPPVLLDAGDRGGRHRFWVRSDATNFRLDADVFGWVCRADPSAEFPARAGEGKRKPPAPLPVTATSYGESDNLLAYTLADSFRVRVLTRPRRPS
jgi:hypothetical protein